MNWLYYLLEANAYLTVIYGVYYVALRHETFYQLNRAYLLLGCALAFVIPLTQLGVLRPMEKPVMLQIIPVTVEASLTTTATATPTPDAAHPDYLLWIYGAIVGAMLVLFVCKIVQLLWLARRGTRHQSVNGFSLIEIDSADTPAFSFFNYLFISTSASGAETIIRHELVHIRQRHSWDVVYLELFKIVNWFNPVVYLLQSSVKELHEYIADEQLGKNRQEINDYTDFLLSNAYGAFATSLTNNFFHKNLLKKRIMMLHKQRSGYLARLKYLLIFPVCGALLCTSTLAFAKSYGLFDLAPQHDTLKPSKAPKRVALEVNYQKVPPPPPPVQSTTGKGFTYKQDGYLLANGRADFRVIIMEKNGTEKAYFRSKSNAATLKLLKDKYGYTFPEMQLHSKLPPPPPMAPAPAKKVAVVKEATLPTIVEQPLDATEATPVRLKLNMTNAEAPVEQAKSIDLKLMPTQKAPKMLDISYPRQFEKLYKQIAQRTHYPAQARDKSIGGRVFAVFTVDDNKRVSGVKIVRSPSKQLSEEVTRVLASCTELDGLVPGENYVIPVTFTIQDAEGKLIPIKADDTAVATVNYGDNVDTSKKSKQLDEVVIVSYSAK